MSKTFVDETKHLKLKNKNIVVSRSRSFFDPHGHFHKNKSVRYWIGGVENNFQKYILSGARRFLGTKMSFSKYILKEGTYDKNIMKELGISKRTGKLMTREEILYAIAYLTRKQSKGQSGALLTKDNAATLVGYMKCDDGVIRDVHVRWDPVNRFWDCDCGYLGYWHDSLGILLFN